jgi:hypothetical protein
LSGSETNEEPKDHSSESDEEPANSDDEGSDTTEEYGHYEVRTPLPWTEVDDLAYLI